MKLLKGGADPCAPVLVLIIFLDLHKHIQSMQTNISMTQNEQQKQGNYFPSEKDKSARP